MTLGRARAGVSPVIAAVLLAVIAIAVAMLFYGWIKTTMSGSTHAPKISVHYTKAYYNETSDTLTYIIELRNIGTADATITDISDSLGFKTQDFQITAYKVEFDPTTGTYKETKLSTNEWNVIPKGATVKYVLTVSNVEATLGYRPSGMSAEVTFYLGEGLHVPAHVFIEAVK